MFEKILQLTNDEKNLALLLSIQRIAILTKIDQEHIFCYILNDMDSFIELTELLTNYT